MNCFSILLVSYLLFLFFLFILQRNMNTRRGFLKIISSGALLLGTGSFPISTLGKADDEYKLTLLHTNDWHSRIEPFPMDGSKYQGLGGAAQRATLIKKIRSEEENVLLFDSGDIFEGTPYFNFYRGELEIKLMSEMGYDASAIGNHDFDAGVSGLAKQLPHATFPFLCANYDFTDTAMAGKSLPYKIFRKGKVKIGVFGLGVELEGLVPAEWFGKTKYSDPVAVANRIAKKLKHDFSCNLVICLSHLGFRYDSKKISDEVLAQQTSNIDMILGGHTHSFFEKPLGYKNADGEQVLVNQVGWAGLVLGRFDLVFRKNFSEMQAVNQNLFIKEVSS